MDKPLIQAGIYKHYKGGLYKVISIAKNTDTNEDMVVYKSVDDERQLWVRPLEIFQGQVKVNGQDITRFEYVNEEV